MTDLMKLVDDHANLWRRVGAHASWPAVDQEKLLAEARELSKDLKAEIARLAARVAGLEPLIEDEENDLEAFRNHSAPESGGDT